MMTDLATTMQRLMLSCAKHAGLFLWAERKTRCHLRLLCYPGFSDHQKSGANTGLFMSVVTFQTRMARLQEARYPVLSLDEAAGCLARGDLPGHATVILGEATDPNDCESAQAVLDHYHFPAAFGVHWDQWGVKSASGLDQRLALPEKNLPGADPCVKIPAQSNPGFNLRAPTCYNVIWLKDNEAVHAIEFEAELSGFLAMWREFKRKISGKITGK